ncbi:MAG TPA: SMP-30/gluconolactonase/LRE family protein, partial [Oscillatoriaceae cyanobacterium]
DDQTIEIQVPQGAHTGDLTVTVDGIPSAAQHFRVWSSLAIGTQLRYLPQSRAIPFALDAVDTDGVHSATATVQWSASGTASVDASGTVTMSGAGSATLSASCGALSAPAVTLTGVGATAAVNTIAGDDQSAFKDGVGANAEFYFPRSLTIGPDGNLYVADEWNSAIRKITPGGTVTTLVGKDSSGQSPLAYPVGIATGPDGNLYVADENGGDVNKVTLAGQVTAIATIDAVKTAQSATSTYLGGIAVASDGTIYVSDTWNNDVLKIKNGQVTVLAGNDSFTGGSADGTGTQASFKTPQALALDGQGDLYVADNGNNAIRKIQLSSGQVSTLTLSGAQLATPYGLALDKSGNLYTTNQMGGQVLKITPQGVVSVLAGSGSFVTLADGPVSSAGFGYTFGLCFDAQGDLYVTEGSDGNVNRLREILMP